MSSYVAYIYFWLVTHKSMLANDESAAVDDEEEEAEEQEDRPRGPLKGSKRTESTFFNGFYAFL